MTVRIPVEIAVPFPPDAPARYLMRHLGVNLAAVAPEKSDRLRGALEGLTLHLLADETWICRTDPSAKTIKVSIGTMTILWCISHAYLKLHDRAFIPWLTGDGKEVTLAEPPDLAAAMRLLSWVITHWNSKDLEPGWTSLWPEGCPRPIDNPEVGSDENLADELALVAVGFLLHHELAHTYQQHTRRPSSIESVQQEQDADREAASWVLSGELLDAIFTKRALGVATALLATTALGIHSDNFGGGTHPRDFDRLKHALDPYILTPYHKVWQFTVLPLKLHMDAMGIMVEPRIYESGRDCFEHYLDVLARYSERSRDR